MYGSKLRTHWTYARALLLAACVLHAGCGGDSEATNGNAVAGMGGSAAAPAAAGSGGGAAGSAVDAGAGKLSFAKDVYDPIIRARCSACHTDAPSFGGLAFFPGAMTAYSNLVGVPAGAADNNLCRASGLLRVQPGDPDRSLIYLKLTKPSCGSQMPPAAFAPPTPAQIEIIRQWIADGAAP